MSGIALVLATVAFVPPVAADHTELSATFSPWILGPDLGPTVNLTLIIKNAGPDTVGSVLEVRFSWTRDFRVMFLHCGAKGCFPPRGDTEVALKDVPTPQVPRGSVVQATITIALHWVLTADLLVGLPNPAVLLTTPEFILVSALVVVPVLYVFARRTMGRPPLRDPRLLRGRSSADARRCPHCGGPLEYAESKWYCTFERKDVWL